MYLNEKFEYKIEIDQRRKEEVFVYMMEVVERLNLSVHAVCLCCTHSQDLTVELTTVYTCTCR